MDFLDNAVIPQPGSNLELLQYLLIMAKLIFLIYSGVLFGSYLFSIIFKYISAKKPDIYPRLSMDFIDLITLNKMMAFGLGIVPFLSIIFIYSQLLHHSAAPVTGFMLFAFVLYLFGLFAVYAYKHSLHLSGIFKNMGGKAENDLDIELYTKSANSLNNRAGVFGLIMLFLSLWVFIGSSSVAVNNDLWPDATFLSGIVLSWHAIVKFAHFLTASLAMTGMAFIVKVFFWDQNYYKLDGDYAIFSRKFNISTAMVFTIFQPAFLVFNLIITPQYALSSFMFGVTVLVIFLAMLLSHFFYIMLREKRFKYINLSFYMLLVIFSFIIIKEQTAFSVSNKQQIAELSAEYVEYETELLASLGRSNVVINGEEIYKAKCTACHKFDVPFTGPPHKEVLPKYMDDTEALVRFILKPVKIDPKYPDMPNQGLKPKEAKAVADYMIEFYGPKLK